MSSTEEVQPAKRSPGRPRKTPAVKPAPAAESEPVKVVESEPAKPKFPSDERIGKPVDDLRWTEIGFDDGRSYRIENGVIVERID